MVCLKGRANPNQHDRIRLFADSGGYCQKPDCKQKVFIEINDKSLTIAEVAHICAASKSGPRAKSQSPQQFLSSYANLLLLCPTCHTIVDKAPDQFPEKLLLEWKTDHRNKIAEIFGATPYSTRLQARKKIEPLLAQNLEVVRSCGPSESNMENPDTPLAFSWKKKLLFQIFPNNRAILAVLDTNRELLNSNEKSVLEKFRQHIMDLEYKHLGDGINIAATRFPPELDQVLKDES